MNTTDLWPETTAQDIMRTDVVTIPDSAGLSEAVQRLADARISGMPVSGISANRSSNVHLINNVVYENSFWNSVSGSGISFFEQRNHGLALSPARAGITCSG